MNIKIVLGAASGILCVIAFIPYISAILKKETKPHAGSWMLWSLIGGVNLAAYWGVGARATIWLAMVNFVGPLLIAILSLRYWKKGFSKFDYICLLISLLSIILWVLSNSPFLALAFNLSADFLAALPTFRKTYLDPSSEDLKTWLIFMLANILSLAAAYDENFAILLLPLYLLFLNITISLLIVRKKLNLF